MVALLENIRVPSFVVFVGFRGNVVVALLPGTQHINSRILAYRGFQYFSGFEEIVVVTGSCSICRVSRGCSGCSSLPA